MAYTINSGSTPTLAVFKKDLEKVVEILKRNQYPANILAPGTVDHLVALADSTLTTSIVAS